MFDRVGDGDGDAERDDEEDAVPDALTEAVAELLGDALTDGEDEGVAAGTRAGREGAAAMHEAQRTPPGAQLTKIRGRIARCDLPAEHLDAVADGRDPRDWRIHDEVRKARRAVVRPVRRALEERDGLGCVCSIERIV